MTTTNTNTLVITREVNAPRELVWKAWTEKDSLAHWWGPKGAKIEVINFDLKPGGIFHYSMEYQGGVKMWGRFEYKEVQPVEKLVFINSFSDEGGNIARAPFFDGGWPLEIMNTLTLVQNADNTTTLTLKGLAINATDAEMNTFIGNHESMQNGFAGTFEQLEDYLATL